MRLLPMTPSAVSELIPFLDTLVLPRYSSL
jgi:hypothetical protein